MGLNSRRGGKRYQACILRRSNIPWLATRGMRVAFISAKNHKRQRRKRQSVTAKQEKSQTQKVLTAILTLPNLT